MNQRLLSIPAAARKAGVPERTMRDRLKKLDATLRSSGCPGFLVRFGGKGSPWKVNVDALDRAIGKGREQSESGALASKLELLETRLTALRNSHQAERRRTAEKWALQERINRRTIEQLSDLTQLSALSLKSGG